MEFCLGRPDWPLYNTTWYNNRFQARPQHHSSLVWARPSVEAEKRLLIIFPILNFFWIPLAKANMVHIVDMRVVLPLTGELTLVLTSSFKVITLSAEFRST